MAAVGSTAVSGDGSLRPHVWRRGDLSLEDVRRLLDSAAGVLRTGVGLERALRQLRSGASSAAAIDAAEMASMICTAALARPQSLGAHQRIDGPARLAV
jgi:aspartate oxidase